MMHPPLRSLRIASLVPSLTELLIALGLADFLVARTGFCIHPRDVVQQIPKVGGTKDVNLAKLRRLAPTHVIVNIDENRLDTAQAIGAWPQEERPEVIITHPCGPEDVAVLIDEMQRWFGHVDGVAEKAAALRTEVTSELASLGSASLPEQLVLYLIWRDPWMTVARDTYISRMLACVRWRTVPAVEGGDHGASRYPIVQGDEAWLSQVQQLLLSSEPYAFDERHVGVAQALCPQARVRIVDGELISWYGPRAAAGLRYLHEMAVESAQPSHSSSHS